MCSHAAKAVRLGTLLKHSFIALLLVLCSSCRDNEPVQPPTTKDPRTYTWTVDTIAAPGSLQTSMRDIWGSSPTDVYVVGHNETGYGKMYHYDGHAWNMVRLVTAEGGLIAGPIDLSAITGFGPNNIYAVGERWYSSTIPDSSLIIHFDGTSWRELPLVRGGILQAIGGGSPNDLWAGGSFGPSLYHITNQLARLVGNDPSFQYASFAGVSASDVYALAYQLDGTTPPFGNMGLWIDQGSGQIYSVGDGGAFAKRQQGWEKLVDTQHGSLLDIFGTSNMNIFTVGTGRMVFHYNGTDWQRLTQLESLTNSYYFSGVWTDGNEAFIVGTNGYMSFVLHGK
jgi:hypothetical protein